jgi:capsular exopolysaccharide synthesis family protein
MGGPAQQRLTEEQNVMHSAVTTTPPRQAAQDQWRLDGVDPHLVSLVDPTSFEADQYRTLRHVLERRHTTKKLIAITSAVAGDGKTTTTLNLAGTLAHAADVRILVVDLDLRTRSLGNRLGLIDQSPGLVDLILDPDLTLNDVIRQHPRFHLSVLPAGPALTVPYELLKSPRMGEILHEVRQLYDYIVLDTPPLVPVPDFRLIADLVDGFVVVVAAHRTPRKLFGDALTLMEASKLIGIVFNGDDRPLHGYYGYYYGYGYYEGRGRHAGWWGNGRLTSALDKALRPFLSRIGHPRE